MIDRGTRLRTLAIVLALTIPSVAALPLPLTGGVLDGLDADRDGYPDEVESAAGTDPENATSTPLSLTTASLLGTLAAAESDVLAAIAAGQEALAEADTDAAHEAISTARAGVLTAVATAREPLAGPPEELPLSPADREALRNVLLTIDGLLAQAAVVAEMGLIDADALLNESEVDALTMASGALGLAQTTFGEAFASSSAVASGSALAGDGILGAGATFLHTSELVTELIGDEDGSGIPVQGAFIDLNGDGIRAPDGSEEFAITDTDQDGFSNRLEALFLTDPASSHDRPLLPDLGHWLTSLSTPLANATMLSDGAFDATIRLERLIGEMGAQGTPLTEITFTAPREFSLANITAADLPQTFVKLDQGVWGPKEPLAGRHYLRIAGVRDVQSGEDSFTLPLRNATAVSEAFHAFHIEACDGPRYFRTCTEGDNVTPRFLVDTIAPTLAFDAFGPDPSLPDITSAFVNLGWTVGLPDATHYAIDESPFTHESAVWAPIAERPATRLLTGTDGPRTLYVGVRDAAMNVRFASDAMTLDVTGPIVALSNSTARAGTGWFTTLPTVTLAAADSPAGIANARLAIAGGGEVVTGMPPLELLVTNGESSVEYAATDALGNAVTGTLAYRVDDEPPFVTSFLSDAGGEWTSIEPTIILNASDNVSQLATLASSFVVDGVEAPYVARTPGEPFLVDTDGQVVVRYRAIDHAGMIATGDLPVVRLDRLAPAAPRLVAPSVVGSASAELTWNEYASGGPSGFARWSVEERIDGVWTPIHETSDANELTLTVADGFVDGLSRTWRVVAHNRAGLWNASLEQNTRADFGAPTVTSVLVGDAVVRDGKTWLVGGSPAFSVIIGDASAIASHSTYGYDASDADDVVAAARLGANDPLELPDSRSIRPLWNVVDEVGNVFASEDPVFGVDVTPPTIDDITVEAAFGEGSFRSDPTFVNFTASDATSGLAALDHSLDGGLTWTTGGETVLHTGTHTLLLRATDVVGHTAIETRTIEVLDLDVTSNIPPLARAVTSIGGSVTVGEAEAQILVVLDGAPMTIAATGSVWSIALDEPLADGEHTIEVSVSDAVGRASGTRVYVVRVDSVAPSATASVPAFVGPAFTSVELHGDEPLDGGALVGIRVGEGDWTSLGTHALPAVVPVPFTEEGPHELRVRGRDLAGNPMELVFPFVRDTLAPDLAQTSSSTVLHANTTTLRFVENDATSVAMELHVVLDDGTAFDFTPASGEEIAVPLGPGTRLLTYTLRATDAAGNEATLAGTVRIVDPSAPAVTARITGELGNAPWLLGPATVQLATSATDATIFSRTDGAAFDARSALTVSGAGMHRVEWYASALRAGVEIRSTLDGADVPIDLAAPSLSPIALPSLGEEGSMLVVRLEASDDASGVASVRALLGDPASPTRTATLARVDGVWTGSIGPMPGAPTTLTILAEDAAGRSATLTQDVDVADTRPPIVVLAPLGTSVLRGSVALSASATDANGIADLWFEVNGARLESSTWDTLAATNGIYTLAAVARDPSNNEARDEHAVRVLNLPTLGEPRLVDDVVAIDVAGPAPSSVVAFARIGTSASFEPFDMGPTDGTFRTLAIPIAPGQGAEIFVVATREGADVRSPPAGTLLVQRAPPADLASWGAERDVAPEIPATTPEHDYIDIVDAGVIVGGGRATFGIELEGALDTSQPAAYVIQFLQADAVVAAYNVSYTPGDATSWNVRLERAGSLAVVSGNGRVLSISERSLAYSVPLALLSTDLGGAPSAVDVRFAAYGSFDTTGAAALDIVPPPIVHTPPTGLVAGSDIVLTATSEPGAVLWAHAEIAGVSLPPVAFSGTTANLGRHDVTSLTYSIVATDTAGNVRVFGPRTLNDTVDPTAAIAVVGGGPAEVAQGQSIALTGEASSDGVGVVDWLWDLDGDGATDARGRRVSTSFASAGTHTVALTVLDAAGNDGRATIPVLVRDVTAPTPFVIFPASGAVLRAGQVSILVSAGDAAGAGVRIDGGAWRALTFNATSAAWRLDLVLAEGPHTLRAAATDAEGNRAESAVATSFFVDATPPTVGLEAAAGDVNQPLRLRATVSDAGGIASMRWDFGDGTSVACSGSCPIQDHTYASGGDFTASVRVVDIASHASTASASVHIVAPVTLASIGGPSEAYAGDAVAFTPPGEGTWRWNFGDGSFATAGATSHVYAAPGDFVVFAEGLTGTYSRAIRIVQRPGASTEPAPLPLIEVTFAAPSSVTVGEPATLTAGSFADAIRLDWDFGDGTSAAGRVVQHAWSAAGTYSVRLDVMLANGQTGSLTRTIDARAPEPPAPPRAEVSVTTDPQAEDEAESEAEETTTPATPALPVTKVSAPTGLVASPATVTFDAGPGTVVYWRFDKSGWHTTNPALIGGEGSVVVEYYAVGAGGREETRSLTLDLDGLSPSVSRVSTSEGRVSARIDDAHLATAQARVLDANGEIVGLVDLVEDGDARAADLAGLAPGAYTVEIVARDALGRETVQAAGTYEVADTPLEETALEGAARETPMGAWPALVALGVALLLARRRRSG